PAPAGGRVGRCACRRAGPVRRSAGPPVRPATPPRLCPPQPRNRARTTPPAARALLPRLAVRSRYALTGHPAGNPFPPARCTTAGEGGRATPAAAPGGSPPPPRGDPPPGTPEGRTPSGCPALGPVSAVRLAGRSEERRVGREWRCGGASQERLE